MRSVSAAPLKVLFIIASASWAIGGCSNVTSNQGSNTTESPGTDTPTVEDDATAPPTGDATSPSTGDVAMHDDSAASTGSHGDTCATPIALHGGETRRDETLPASGVPSTACRPSDAPQRFFALDIPAGDRATIDVTPHATLRAVVRVMLTCDAPDCITDGESAEDGAPVRLIVDNAEDHVLHKIVSVSGTMRGVTGTFDVAVTFAPLGSAGDSDAGSDDGDAGAGTDAGDGTDGGATMEPPSGNRCDDAIPLTSGVALVSQDFASGTEGNVTCADFSAPPPRYYTITIPPDSLLRIEAMRTSTPPGHRGSQPQIRLFSACSAASCLAGTNGGDLLDHAMTLGYVNTGSAPLPVDVLVGEPGVAGDRTIAAGTFDVVATITPRTSTREVASMDLGDRACAVMRDGTLRCAGSNVAGQIGDGTRIDRWLPITVPGLSGVASVATGTNHTCALLGDGTVRCWGNCGTTWCGSSPAAVPGLTNVVELALGTQFTCARRNDGTVWCFGTGWDGRLGDGTIVDRSTPAPVTGLSDAIAIAAGNAHACALRATGTVVCWGLNDEGQLGEGTTVDRWTPVAVVGLSDIVAIDAGARAHTCALRRDGTVACWGENRQGQLGYASTETCAIGAPCQTTPRTVPGLNSVDAITLGAVHSCAHLADGSGKCWGDNSRGQLGDGTSTNSTTPLTLRLLTPISRLAAGDSSVCAILADATVSCWGDNRYGQLGDGTRTSRLAPVVTFW